MRLDEECRLSFYQQIASLNEDHGVYLVQNISDKKIYVKKILKIYNVEVFRYLKDNPIKNTPRIYEVIEDSNQLIVLEEYISGTTLQQILDEQKVLKEEQVENIIRQLWPGVKFCVSDFRQSQEWCWKAERILAWIP